ncbi:MAG TPA: YcxB family protein [Vicinamibacteria bacterium]|nr:YcxB family protein [Vicinamibacteria bacterium]
MEIEYTLSAQDLRNAWRAHDSLSVVADSFMTPTAVAMALLGILGLWMDRESAVGWIGLILGVVFASVAWVRNRRLWAHWRDHAAGLGTFHLSISEEGIIGRQPHTETRAGWKAYAAAHESADGFLLYHTKASYLFIPLRAFRGPLDIEAFRTLLGRKVPDRRWQ